MNQQIDDIAIFMRSVPLPVGEADHRSEQQALRYDVTAENLLYDRNAKRQPGIDLTFEKRESGSTEARHLGVGWKELEAATHDSTSRCSDWSIKLTPKTKMNSASANSTNATASTTNMQTTNNATTNSSLAFSGANTMDTTAKMMARSIKVMPPVKD